MYVYCECEHFVNGPRISKTPNFTAPFEGALSRATYSNTNPCVDLNDKYRCLRCAFKLCFLKYISECKTRYVLEYIHSSFKVAI